MGGAHLIFGAPSPTCERRIAGGAAARSGIWSASTSCEAWIKFADYLRVSLIPVNRIANRLRLDITGFSSLRSFGMPVASQVRLQIYPIISVESMVSFLTIVHAIRL